MNKSLSLAIATAMLAVAGTAFAYPSLAGPTGTGVLPTAAVSPAGQLHVAADLYDAQQEDSNTIPIRLVYGIGGNMEFGGGLIAGGLIAGDSTAWNVNGKICFPLTMVEGGTWALGARFTSVDFDAPGETALQCYGVMSKDFHSSGATLRASVGLNWTEVTFDHWYGDTSNDAIRPFVSLNVSLPNRLNLAVDYQFADSNLDDSALRSIVLRYPFTSTFAGEVGFANMNVDGVTGNDDSGFFVGGNFIFGGA